eukprot:scaffold851_cov67-Phaeocystis_antarctica.AAC.4
MKYGKAFRAGVRLRRENSPPPLRIVEGRPKLSRTGRLCPHFVSYSTPLITPAHTPCSISNAVVRGLPDPRNAPALFVCLFLADAATGEPTRSLRVGRRGP